MHSPHQDLILEAEEFLKTLRNTLLVAARAGSLAGLEIPVSTIDGLCRRAEELGLSAINLTLSALKGEAGRASLCEPSGSEEFVRSILDNIANAEAEVVKARHFSEDDHADPLDLFGPPVGAAPPDSTTAAIPEADLETQVNVDGFEADAELLEIFSIEAEDLLSKIEFDVDALKASPENKEALWEIRRNAHTFKGAAGIIGLSGPSRLAHRVEDLLDHLSQTEFTPGRDLVELIEAAARGLRSLTSGDSSAETLKEIAEVYSRFDAAMSRVQETNPTEDRSTTTQAYSEFPAIPIPSEVRTPNRPIVRVSLARLDELAKLVSDLVVSRTIIDQRVAEMEMHLESLAHITRRFQGVNAKIENSFEASLLTAAEGFSTRRPARVAEGVEMAVGRTYGFDPLEFDRYTDFHETSRELSESAQDLFAVFTILESLKGSIESAFDDHRRIVDETQAKIRQIRLIKIGSLTTRLQRAVTVTCDEIGNRAEIVLENEDVELDTDVLDSLVEPLMHLTRNAVAHGIESPETRRLLGKPEKGRITVAISNEETHVELTVIDDGRGIEAAALKDRAVSGGLISAGAAEGLDHTGLLSLIFLPGLTTAERLSLSSGRGVGMSIVKESVESRGGTIDVESSSQKGTKFVLRIPLAFGTTNVLLVRSAGRLAAIPLKTVKQTVEVTEGQVRIELAERSGHAGSPGTRMLVLGENFGTTLPAASDDKIHNALTVETGGLRFTLVVDEILRTEEVAIKKLGVPLDAIPGLLGAAILGSGEIVPVLDVAGLRAVGPQKGKSRSARQDARVRPRVLIVDDSPSVRHTTQRIVKAAGWEAAAAKDGVEAMEMLERGDRPTIILTDIEMPRMNGFELVAALRGSAELADIPVVFITSRVGEKHRKEALDLGVSDYVTKPFADGELIETMERLFHACTG
ncbi:MAG TPA: response regulator [Pyrinomonadaceae bacterium]|nr:response regulator [Pyrinomonadaceae bacterium]